MRTGLVFAAAFAATVAGTAAQAQTRTVTVRVENVAPTNSVAFAPLRVGFGNGTFDSFDNGGIAGSPIISVAEGGSGSAWFPAFAAFDPTAVLGSVGGALLPGQSASARFTVDAAINPFFTFASMVIPSNDFFIGNDNPAAFRLFDAQGRLVITSIDQYARDIWNAGSETFDPAAAAFLQGGVNGLRTPENGRVGFNFTELSGFNGLTTAAGYNFQSNLAADTAIYRISFTSAVPEPATWGMLIIGFGAVGGALRHRTTSRRRDQGVQHA